MFKSSIDNSYFELIRGNDFCFIQLYMYIVSLAKLALVKVISHLQVISITRKKALIVTTKGLVASTILY